MLSCSMVLSVGINKHLMAYRIAILISGRGSNMLALADYAGQDAVDADIAVVIADQPAAGLDQARDRGIPTQLIDRSDYANRQDHETAVMTAIDGARGDGAGVDGVFLAGYMRVLSARFCQHYENRLFNIHPSLLPRHKGLDTHQRALDAGDERHGCSVHMVTAELDDGPVLLQRDVPVLKTDDATSLAARVLVQEHMIYPMVLGALATGLLDTTDGKIDMKIGHLPGVIPNMQAPISWPE